MKSKISILIAVLALALMSCLENDIKYNTDDAEYRPWEFGVPVGKIRATLFDGLKKVLGKDSIYLNVNDDDVICIRYTDTVKIEWDDSDFKIQPISSPNNWKQLVPPISQPDVSLPSYNLYESVSVTTESNPDVSITKAELAVCRLNLVIDVPPNLIASVIIRIPQLKNPEKNNFVRLYPGLQEGNHDLSEILINHEIVAPDNEIELICDFTVTSVGGPSEGGLFSVELSVEDFVVDYMEGNFGQMEYKPDDADKEMTFGFFDNLDFDGTVGFKDIVFETKIINSLGADFMVEANKINFITEGEQVPLMVEDGNIPLSDVFKLDVPSATMENGFKPGEKSISKTLSALEFKNGEYPTGIQFDFFGMLNHPNGGGRGNNFVLFGVLDLTEAHISLNIPLHVNVENYYRSDTLKFDFNDIVGNNDDNITNIEYIYITLLIDNGLPFDVFLEAIVINESGEILSGSGEIESWSLIIPKVEILSDQNLNSKGQQSVEIKLDVNQLEKFRTYDIKKIVLISSAQTTEIQKDNFWVKAKKDAYLAIDVSMRIKADILSIILNQ